MTLRDLFAVKLYFKKLTIMKEKYQVIIDDEVTSVYEYEYELNHKHKRMYKNAEKILKSYGDYEVTHIEMKENFNLLIKIKERGSD